MPVSCSSETAVALVAQIIRYAGTGAMCAVASNVIMIGGSLVGVHYLPMAFITFALVTPVAYFLHSRLTFRERLSIRRLLRFTSGMIGGFLLCIGSLAFLCSGLGTPVFVAMPAATILVFIVNYLIARWAIVLRSQLG